MEKKSLDCVLQHLKTFREQAQKEEVADFGEPCQACIHAGSCNYNWFSNIYPLLNQSNVKISMAAQELIQQQDKILSEIEQDMDIQCHRGNKN